MLLKTMLIVALMGSCGVVLAQTADARNAGDLRDRPQPCYVVIAVDVSGSMESSDPPESGIKGRTFRDEGQLVFLQMLPFVRSDLYIGVAHFSDKVRYSLPSEDTGPLLPWGQTFLPESACRNMVRSAEFMATFHTDIAESMGWASSRIAAARRQHGQGPAKLIILTNGDPRDSARELERGRGPLQSMAKRFAEQQIQVYPILISAASLRSADKQSRLSADEIAAEDLMQSVALTTGGKAYRLSRELGFADILMDAFGLGLQIRSSDATDRAGTSDLLVSGHDWAIVAVGEPLKSATVTPVGGSDETPRTLTIDGNLEAGSGIRANVIASSSQQTTILRRPETGDFVDRFWQGKWTLGSAQAKSPAVRLYRIPDFLVQLELEPELPWWRHEQVKARACLLERHRKGPALGAAASSESGTDLSIRMRAVSSDGKDSVAVDQGRWTSPSQLYDTDPFVIGMPGLYKLTCELRHRVGDANVPLLRLTNDVYVYSECVGVQVVNAATNEVLGDVPSTADATLNLALPGGQDVYLRIVGKGEFKVEPQSGVLHLEPLSQADWSLRKDDLGTLTAGPVRLVEGEERLFGRAELEVRTQAGVRQIRLPRFNLAYPPAPLRIECRFTDTREALWVGEFHKQPLVITAFPVFDSFRDATLKRFPDAFAQTQTRTVDMQSGTTQVTKLQSRVLNPAQPTGDQGRTVAATYFVESPIPIPSADRCEVELGQTMADLRGTTKTYAIVDPVAQGLFKWAVTQPGQSPSRQSAVSETLFCGEPVQFHAEWRADQNISAVRFEFPQTDSNEPVFVEMPVAAGTNQANLDQVVSGLSLGKTVPVYVHVTMQPAGGDRALQIKLKGGQFRAEDRRVVLEDLRAGEGGPTDITAYAWEPVEIPLRVVFTGYVATDARHNAAIEQFKKSCIVTVASKAGDARNVSDTIEWTSVSSPEGPAKRCELIGHATYTPDVPGRASIEVTADTPAVQGAGEASPRRAYAHLLAKAPRLAVTIRKVTPTGEEPVFDSRRWSTGEGGVSALMTRFSARLKVDIRPNDWAATGQSQPWRTAIRLLRRPTPDAEWSPEFSDANELTADRTFLREVQIAGNGEYALEVSGYDAQFGRRTVFFTTPVIASIRPHEIKPAMAPPAWLTSRVRQWPFEYQVTLQQEAADASQPQSLAFQFQLPGQMQAWMDGTASSIPSQTPDARQLLVKGPKFLPVSQGLQ
ncbi:MAG: vWA domain-containing protein, partial [Solirubrobacterales bacterium]